MTGTPTLTVSGNWTNSGTFNAGSGTVIFNGPAQTVSGGTTFNNLTLSGTGIVTFGSQGFTSVNGIYLVGNGSNNNVYASNIQYGPNAGLQYFTSGTTPRVVNSAEWPGTFTGLGGVTINGTGAVSLNGAKIMGSNTAVNLTIASGATLITNSDNLTLNGSLFNPAGSGSSLGLQAGSSNITLTGTLASQSIDGFATAGLITMTKTGGTATFTGSVNGTSLIINGTGGTLNLGGSGLSHTFTGSWTSTSGTLDGGSATVYFTSTTAPFYSYTGGSFLPDNGTVNYSGAGAQTIAAVTYYNLVLSGSGAKSFPVNTTILSDLSINNATAGATADLGMALTHSAISLHLDGNSELAGYYGSPLSPAPPANQLPTYFGSTATGILNVGGACIPGNWTGEISSDWNTAGNWCSGTVPNSTTSVVIPILVNNNYPVISAADTCANITINAGASLTISGTNTLSVFGNWTSTGATFTPNSSEVVFSGGAQTLVGSPTFNSLTLAGSGTFTLNGSVTVNDTLSIENGTNSIVTGANGLLIYGPAATLQYNDGSASRTSGFEWPPIFVAAGGVVIKGSGTITMNNALQIGDLTHSAPLNILTGTLSTSASNYALTFYGNFLNTGILSAGASAINIAGTAAQSIAGFTTTGTVSMLKTGGTATLTGNVNGGALTMNGSGGTLNMDTGVAGAGLTHAFTGAWTRTNGSMVLNSSKLLIGGTTTGTVGAFTAGTGLVNYNGAAQTIANVAYYNLTLSGSGIKTTTGATVADTLSLEGTATATAVPVYGAAATLQYKGSAAQTTGPEFPATFSGTGGLAINNTLGVTLATASKTVTGPVNLIAGVLSTTTAYTLTANGMAQQTAGWVNGRLILPVATGVQTLNFPIGDATTYAPVSVAFASVTTAGTLTASTFYGPYRANGGFVKAGLDSTWCVRRYWTITPATTVFTTASATLNWASPGDIINATSTSTFTAAKYNTSWSFLPNNPPTATSITTTGLTSFGDFIVGNLSSTTGTGILTTPGKGTFTVPVGVTSIQVYTWGAGGGGGGRLLFNFYAGGGGGGGGFEKATLAVTPGQVFNYTIGSGGAGSSQASGTAGQNTTFSGNGYTVTANGGAGGGVGQTPNYGVGGAGGKGSVAGTGATLPATFTGGAGATGCCGTTTG